MEKLIEKLPWIVLILIGVYFCYRLWKAGRCREPDKEIYDKELAKKALDEIELRDKLKETMELTDEERNVLNDIKGRKHWKQAINKIAIDVSMDKEKLRKILISLKDKGYLINKTGKDGAQKWVVKR